VPRAHTLGAQAVAAALVVTGCILAVPGGEPSGRCRFTGDDSAACGKCISLRCGTFVNACCAEAECRDTALAKLDPCASGGACGPLLSASGAATPQALAQCIRRECGTECAAGDGSTDGGVPRDGGSVSLTPKETFCSPLLSSSSSYCECVVPGNAEDAPRRGNTSRCDPTTGPNTDAGVTTGPSPGVLGVCCASKDWPAPLSECTCYEPFCNKYANACVCELTELASFTVANCARGVCCEGSDGACRCDPTGTTCQTGTTKVDTCEKTQVRCGSGRIPVDRCSTL